jgi:hypothetical protein
MTVSENMEGFTKEEVEGAQKARKLYHAIGCPSVENMKHMLQMNMIKNCPVTTQDVVNAERIFGPDIATLKGKTTHRSPPRIINDMIEVPEELKNFDDLVLCIDIMFVAGLPFLTAIDKPI